MASEKKEKVSPGTSRKMFTEINEKHVDDVKLEVFYTSRSLTLLGLCIFGLTYTAFTRDSSVSHQSNLLTGLCGVFIFFMIISVLAFPNGKFAKKWSCNQRDDSLVFFRLQAHSQDLIQFYGGWFSVVALCTFCSFSSLYIWITKRSVQ